MTRKINGIEDDLLTLLHQIICKEGCLLFSQVYEVAMDKGYDESDVNNALQILVQSGMIQQLLTQMTYGDKVTDFRVTQDFVNIREF